MLKQAESSVRAGAAALAWADGAIERVAREGKPALLIAERFTIYLMWPWIDWRQDELGLPESRPLRLAATGL